MVKSKNFRSTERHWNMERQRLLMQWKNEQSNFWLHVEICLVRAISPHSELKTVYEPVRYVFHSLHRVKQFDCINALESSNCLFRGSPFTRSDSTLHKRARAPKTRSFQESWLLSAFHSLSKALNLSRNRWAEKHIFGSLSRKQTRCWSARGCKKLEQLECGEHSTKAYK